MERLDLDAGDGVAAHLRRREGAKKGVWWLCAYIDGQQVFRSTKRADLREAETVARQMLYEAKQTIRGGGSIRKAYFGEVALAFLAEKIGRPTEIDALADADERKDRRFRRRRVETCLIPFFEKFGRIELASITEDHIKAYPEWRQERRDADREAGYRGNIGTKISPHSINQELYILDDIFDFAVSKHWVERRDLVNLAQTKVFLAPRAPKRKRPIGDDVFNHLMRKAEERWRLAVAEHRALHKQRTGSDPAPDAWKGDLTAWGRYRLMHAVMLVACSGLRPSSLVRLRRSDVRTMANPATAENIMRQAQGREPAFYYLIDGMTHKGAQQYSDKIREGEIAPDLDCYEMLTEYLQHFPDQDAILFDITGQALNRAFKSLCDAAKISGFTFYALRHTYITRKIEQDASINLIADNTLTSIPMIKRHYDGSKISRNIKHLVK